jgi:lysosomal Pro-X carboxypeptidase
MKQSLILLTLLSLEVSCLRELATRHELIHKNSKRLSSLSSLTKQPRNHLNDHPGVVNCTLNYFTQQIDHFSFAATPTGAITYQQRYFTYDKYWKKDETGAVFFYVGNEADVTLYVEHTGLMWEHAQEMNARIVFAEHRYYGTSQPFGAASSMFYEYMTHEQALADYAALAYFLSNDAIANGGVKQPFIAFGGSYGGMLTAWARIKYPGTFAGGIAASAPVAFFTGTTPSYNNETYWNVVTQDAQSGHGSAQACATNVRAAFSAIYTAAQTSSGLSNLSSVFQLCTPLNTPKDADAMAVTLHLNAWDTLAMGK